MKIYPKTEHLKIPMICSSFLGIFPWQFMFEQNPFIQRCYAVFSKIMLSYYIFFTITAYIQLVKLVNEEIPRMDEISGNLCVTLLYTITIIRQLIIKFHPGVTNIIEQIIHTEKIINAQEDKEVIKIYNDTAKDTSKKCKMYLSILFVIIMLYIFRPLVVTGYEKQIGNSTVLIKSLPLSSWFPFDEQTFYLAAYLWQLLDILVGGSFLTYTDILMFSLIVYPTGQLKILQYILRNFEMYRNRIQVQFKIDDDNTAAFVTFRECIRHHKEIIQYVDYFNASMNVIMVFEFLQSSLQIATIWTQVFGNKMTLILLSVVGSFLIGMLLRLFLYYYYANEVVVLSTGLSLSLWESNWYEQPPEVKFMMFIFLMMTQKPLKLKIGPFSVMSLDSFISIYPKTEHLKIPMICSSSLGIFPWQFMFEQNPFIQSCYAVFSKIMLSYYIFFLITAYMQLVKILSEENPRMDEISGNLCITLIYTITIIRQLIIKFHPGFKNIIRDIIDTEKIINAQEDKEVIKIYNDTAKDTSRKCKMYLSILFVITMLYIFRPLVVTGYEKQIGNSTVFIKSLPLSSWFPFDEQTWYLAAYLWHVLDSLVGASFVTYTDILMFSLIVYPTGQLKILQYILRNFDMYRKRIQLQLRIDDVNTAAFVTFRECIQQHKKIIQYVDYFNASMNALMVFDFLQSSLQIATILTQVIGNKITLMLLAFVGAFFLGMLLRLVMYYYYANEVVVLSTGLSLSVWESNWYEQAPNVKFMMFIFIMMVQKSLKLKIGPFSVMSLDSFISILKATYSYIMLMYTTN